MDMYVKMYDDLKKNKDDNPTIGIILCSDKEETAVKYPVLSWSKKLFAARYKLYLPTKEELKRLIVNDRFIVEETAMAYGEKQMDFYAHTQDNDKSLAVNGFHIAQK
jgi:hypothetical protein